MNRTEHLLALVSEECAEVQQNVSKTLRFGIDEIKEGLDITNAERVCYEMRDLISIFKMLEADGSIPATWFPTDEEHEAKRAKVERYIGVSADCGTIKLENVSVERWAKVVAGSLIDIYAAVLSDGSVSTFEVKTIDRQRHGTLWADSLAQDHFEQLNLQITEGA